MGSLEGIIGRQPGSRRISRRYTGPWAAGAPGSVGHGVRGEGAVFGQQLPAAGVSIQSRAHPVNHVCEAIEGVVLESHTVAGRIIDEDEIANGIVGITRRALGRATAAEL